MLASNAVASGTSFSGYPLIRQILNSKRGQEKKHHPFSVYLDPVGLSAKGYLDNIENMLTLIKSKAQNIYPEITNKLKDKRMLQSTFSEIYVLCHLLKLGIVLGYEEKTEGTFDFTMDIKCKKVAVEVISYAFEPLSQRLKMAFEKICVRLKIPDTLVSLECKEDNPSPWQDSRHLDCLTRAIANRAEKELRENLYLPRKLRLGKRVIATLKSLDPQDSKHGPVVASLSTVGGQHRDKLCKWIYDKVQRTLDRKKKQLPSASGHASLIALDISCDHERMHLLYDKYIADYCDQKIQWPVNVQAIVIFWRNMDSDVIAHHIAIYNDRTAGLTECLQNLGFLPGSQSTQTIEIDSGQNLS